MAALRRVQVAPGECGVPLQMSAGCSRQVTGAAEWCWPFLSPVNQLQTPPLEQLMSLPGAAPQTWPYLL